MNQIFQKPGQPFQPPKLKFNNGPEPATTGSEEVRWARVHREKKRLEQDNKTRQKKRRLVCFTCWGYDGSCCCNIHEVPADHPLVQDGQTGHHWKCARGDGSCVTIPDAVRLTNDGRNPP